ncbi:MAG: hypothetical protein EZS28_012938, partial [Streblomastix strix]
MSIRDLARARFIIEERARLFVLDVLDDNGLKGDLTELLNAGKLLQFINALYPDQDPIAYDLGDGAPSNVDIFNNTAKERFGAKDNELAVVRDPGQKIWAVVALTEKVIKNAINSGYSDKQPTPENQISEPSDRQLAPYIQLIEQEDREISEGRKENLVVTMIGVKDVAAMDSNGKSDPFVKLILGTQKKETKKVKDTLNAEFNETFKFAYDPDTELGEDKARVLKMELWDYDTIGDNDQIGKADVDFNKYLNKKQKDSISFKGVEKLYGQDVGVLDIEIEYTKAPPSEAQQAAITKREKEIDLVNKKKERDAQIKQLEQDEKDGKNEKVVVKVIGVKDVISNDIGEGASDPYIKVNYEGAEQKTQKVKDTANAEYNETFEFPITRKVKYEEVEDENGDVQFNVCAESGDIDEEGEKEVKFELWDYDTVGSDDILGKVQVKLAPYTNQKGAEQLQFIGVGDNYGKNVGVADLEIEYINTRPPKEEKPIDTYRDEEGYADDRTGGEQGKEKAFKQKKEKKTAQKEDQQEEPKKKEKKEKDKRGREGNTLRSSGSKGGKRSGSRSKSKEKTKKGD